MMYNDMMGVYHEDAEHPPSNKENTTMAEDKPPSTIKENRESIQHDDSGRLPDGSLHSNSVRNSTIRSLQLAYIHLAVGGKPYLGYHNSTHLY